MDSQLTLINPTIPDIHTILYFDKDSMRNTTLRRADGTVAYIIQSNKSFSRTTIFKGTTDEKFATLAFRNILGDTVQFHTDDKMKISDWLLSRRHL
jgi:hypothetical protein